MAIKLPAVDGSTDGWSVINPVGGLPVIIGRGAGGGDYRCGSCDSVLIRNLVRDGSEKPSGDSSSDEDHILLPPEVVEEDGTIDLPQGIGIRSAGDRGVAILCPECDQHSDATKVL